MRGTVAKRLRREAFQQHRYDKKPSILERVLKRVRIFNWGAGEKKNDVKVSMYQNVYGPGYKRTYRDLKKAYRSLEELRGK